MGRGRRRRRRRKRRRRRLDTRRKKEGGRNEICFYASSNHIDQDPIRDPSFPFLSFPPPLLLSIFLGFLGLEWKWRRGKEKNRKDAWSRHGKENFKVRL